MQGKTIVLIEVSAGHVIDMTSNRKKNVPRNSLLRVCWPQTEAIPTFSSLEAVDFLICANETVTYR